MELSNLEYRELSDLLIHAIFYAQHKVEAAFFEDEFKFWSEKREWLLNFESKLRNYAVDNLY